MGETNHRVEVTDRMKRLMTLLLAAALLLCCPVALADDVFTVRSASDASGSVVTSDCSYLCVAEDVGGGAAVTLTISSDGAPVYQRDYGVCSGVFRSEDIYLRLSGKETDYQVTLSEGDTLHRFTLRRVMPRLTGNAACSVGYPLDALTGNGGWKTATLIDVSALEGGSITVPLHASDAYELGSVTFSVHGGKLTVTADLNDGAQASVDKGTVYVATTAMDARTLCTRDFRGLTGKLGRSIDLGGAKLCAVYVGLTVSFDPTALPASPDVVLDGQEDLWFRMLNETPGEAVG